MKYATLCSGIEGFGVGFDAVGMECVFQCEQDPQCLKLLSAKWPHVSRTSDVNDERTAEELVRLRPDVLTFGSPCQDLSVAGNRGGLSAERSGLFFRCVELAFTCQAGLVVWENVPGVFSSNGGRDFAAVLEAFTGFAPGVPRGGWRNTGVCVGPLYSVAWAVLDAQWFGVPQRRRRVFLVASLGDRGRAYEILSLAQSLPWDSPPRRETGARVAGGVAACLNSGGGSGGFRTEPGEHLIPHRPGRRDGGDVNIFAYGGNNTRGPIDVATCVNAKASSSSRQDFESETFVAHTLRAECHDASEDGTGRGAPIIPIDMRQASRGAKMTNNRDEGSSGGPPGTGVGVAGDPAPTIAGSHVPAVAVLPSHQQASCGEDTAPYVGVRRLTALECERLMGFPDGWTEGFSDSCRYRMLGNSIAVPVARWIGQRIMQTEGVRA